MFSCVVKDPDASEISEGEACKVVKAEARDGRLKGDE